MRFGQRWGAGAVGIAAACALWYAARLVPLARQALPPLDGIARDIGEGFDTGLLGVATMETARVALIAAGLAAAVGIPLGFVMGATETGENLFSPLIELMRPVPSVAFIPIAIILVGLDDRTGVIAASFASVWPILFSTKAGIEGIDRRTYEVAELLGVRGWRRWVRTALPASLPAVSTGLRLALTSALVVTITAEIVVGWGGLGTYMETGRQVGDAGAVWAGVFVAGMAGYAINLVALLTDRHLLRWSHASTRRSP